MLTSLFAECSRMFACRPFRVGRGRALQPGRALAWWTPRGAGAPTRERMMHRTSKLSQMPVDRQVQLRCAFNEWMRRVREGGTWLTLLHEDKAWHESVREGANINGPTREPPGLLNTSGIGVQSDDGAVARRSAAPTFLPDSPHAAGPRRKLTRDLLNSRPGRYRPLQAENAGRQFRLTQASHGPSYPSDSAHSS